MDSNLKEGNWIYWYDKGTLKCQGNYHKDKKEGHWLYLQPTGTKVQEGDYQDDKPSGKWDYYYETGVLMQEQMLKDGKPSGKCTSNFPDGKIQSVTNFSIQRDKNGEIRSVPDGTWIYYDKNGNVTKKVNYKNGEVQ
jgi:antitoxin component YwqK of YwqJK toxin-antitoxin module